MNHIAEQPPKFLLSFHYFRNLDFDEWVESLPLKPMIFADSGAYSAFSQGAEINIKEYAQWLKRWSHHFDVYVNLDVIRDPKATGQNQAILERAGLQPIPVFHTGTDWKHLDRLMKRYPYIALGGMVGAERTTTLRWAATCHKRALDYGCVFHGFGQTSRDNIMALPWYSVDSSSWASGFMYGNLDVWDGRQWLRGKIGNAKSIALIAPQIRRIGIDPMIFADRNRYKHEGGYECAVAVAAISWHHFEAFLRRRHGPIPLPARTKTLQSEIADQREGGHLYLASASSTEMRRGNIGLNLYLAQVSKRDMTTQLVTLLNDARRRPRRAERFQQND